jgi:hypothetical protein
MVLGRPIIAAESQERSRGMIFNRAAVRAKGSNPTIYISAD